MKKNFKTLKAGHYYRRVDGMIAGPITQDAEGDYWVNSRGYHSNGNPWYAGLHTEVYDTLVEHVYVDTYNAQKPRECWVVAGPHGVNTNWLPQVFKQECHPSIAAECTWILMREVIDDE